MKSTSILEISESALKNNIDFLQNTLGDSCVLSAVIKGNAYGHGITSYAPLAAKCGVKHFSVFSASEAFQAKQVLPNHCQIMIMGMVDKSDLQWAIENEISFFVFELSRLHAAIEVAKKINRKAIIHIELETGLNRTGFDETELMKVVELIKSNEPHLILEGLCTHYAGAESISNYVRIQNQIALFHQRKKWLLEQNLAPKKYHTACSAAAINYPATQMDLARIGIMQYGFWSNKETYVSYVNRHKLISDPLQRVISWKSAVMSIQHVKSGEFIGYGSSYFAESDMNIAIVPVGYSHGYSRSLSNHGRVLIGGHRLGVVGLVNMNMLVVDISNAPETKIGDEVVLIGKQGDHNLSVASFSEMSDQLNYELLTRLPQDIPRIITA